MADADYIKLIKELLLFKEPQKVEKFILKENKRDKEPGEQENSDAINVDAKRKKSKGMHLNKNSESKQDEKQKQESNEHGKKEQKSEISEKLSVNLEYMKRIYSIPQNGDIILREFDIVVKDKVIPAFMLFYDGMVDRKVINDDILQPLMLLSNLDIKGDEKCIAEFVRNHLLPHNQLNEVKDYRKVIDEINFGGCGIFLEGMDSAFAADVKGWEHRGVERPNTEQVIRGPQEGFTEILRVNTALVRKILKDEDLIVENITIGRRSKTPCSMLYIKDITNDSLVNEMRRRLENIKLDYIIDSGELEQLLEESGFSPAPQVIATERPDRVASLLSEGKVAVILNGSPFALVAPATLAGLVHSPEDSYVRYPYANLLRLVRIIGILFSLLLPGVYIAITTFHQEMIPTDLLFAIEASREKVPFPSLVELLIMEIMFELIREAGIRIPGPIGPTLGIIGALILGQAAVSANIVSPILIIVVAVTGIGSFAVPNFSLGLTFRILRFAYIFLGAMSGFLGITVGLFIQGIFFTSSKSFGVPITVPFGPKTTRVWGGNELIRSPIWKQERRSDYLNTKDEAKQPNISRKWAEQDEGSGNNEE